MPFFFDGVPAIPRALDYAGVVTGCTAVDIDANRRQSVEFVWLAKVAMALDMDSGTVALPDEAAYIAGRSGATIGMKTFVRTQAAAVL